MELGRIGIWDWLGGDRADVREAAAELDELGYGALWFPSRPTRFELGRELLDAAQRDVLAPEQAVVLETDPDRARALGRQHLHIYLMAPNYTSNWLRLGFTPDDLEDGGSDRLVDAMVAWGDEDAIRSRIAAHHEAGADHVCIQVITDGAQLPREEWRTPPPGPPASGAGPPPAAGAAPPG